MLGLIVALVGIFLADHLGIPELDGVASIVIGIVLGCTAVLLAYESKGLLIGEGARPRVIEGIRRIASEKNGIERVNELLTMHFGPKEVLLTLSVDFDSHLTADQVESTVSELELSIKEEFPEVTRVFIEAQNWRAHLESLQKAKSGHGEDATTTE